MMNKYFGREDLEMEGLVSAAAELLPSLVGSQTRYKVTEIPDERTIRYYMSEGLVDRPLGYRGAGGLYGTKHLLQLVAVKRLQSDSLSIKQIKEIVTGLDEAGLRKLIEGRPAAQKAAESSSLAISSAQSAVASSKGGGLGSGLLGMILGRSRPAPSPEPPALPPAVWTRHEIAPGVEVHLRNDFNADRPSSYFKALATRFEQLLRQSGGGTA